jgi:hypothetical protein
MTEKQLKRWSQEVTEHSSALDLAKDVFTLKDPKEIALSLKHSAEVSERRKRTGVDAQFLRQPPKKNPRSPTERLGKAKDELRAVPPQPGRMMRLLRRRAEDVACRRSITWSKSRHEAKKARARRSPCRCSSDRDARRRQHEHAAGMDRPSASVLEIELAGAGDDVFAFLRRVGVPAEALAGLDLVHDGRGCGGAMPAIDGKGASPMHGGVGLAPHLSAFELVGIDNRILENHPSGEIGAL